MFDKILRNINSISSLSNEENRAFSNICRSIKISKKEFVFMEGDVCTNLFFINSGLLHVFFVVDGNERTCRFFFENMWYTDFSSFINENVSEENFQALLDSEIIQITKEDIENLYVKYPRMERIGRLLAEQAFIEIQNRNKLLTTETPEYRYLRLVEEHPHLVDKIPQYYLASYLNIQPESLSRIKKRVLLR
jgi:CRP-like cAMP-binding protein